MGRALAPGYQLSLAAVWFRSSGDLDSLRSDNFPVDSQAYPGTGGARRRVRRLILYVLNWAAVGFLAPSMRGQ